MEDNCLPPFQKKSVQGYVEENHEILQIGIERNEQDLSLFYSMRRGQIRDGDERVAVYRHCEYQSLTFVQVHGAAHAVGPVNPFPPHWPQR